MNSELTQIVHTDLKFLILIAYAKIIFPNNVTFTGSRNLMWPYILGKECYTTMTHSNKRGNNAWAQKHGFNLIKANLPISTAKYLICKQQRLRLGS